MRDRLEFKAAPIRNPFSDTWKKLHRLADAENGPARAAFLEAIAKLHHAVSIDELAAAIANGNVEQVLRLIPFDDLKDALDTITQDMDRLRSRTFDVATNEAIPLLQAEQLAIHSSGTMTVRLSFGAASSHVVSAIRSAAAARIVGITDRTRDTIRAILESGYVAGVHPRQMARDVQTSIGLTPRQSNAVDAYRGALTDAGTPVARVDRLVERMRTRKLKERSVLIARTESMQAMNDGQRAAWETLRDRGLLDDNQFEREWLAIVPSDGRTCPICEKLDGKRAKIGGNYPVPGEKGPPAHPDCRCTEQLVPVRDTPDPE